jgi:hypothetical protein
MGFRQTALCQVVCRLDAFRALGFKAYSGDVNPGA